MFIKILKVTSIIFLGIAIIFYFLWLGKKFFPNTDEIIHYHFTKEIESIKRNSLLDSIVNYYTPEKLPEDFFLNNLETVGFKKILIPKDQIDDINWHFAERVELIKKIPACETIFRDILVFKEHNQIIGFSKICFECGISYTLSIDKNAKDFDQAIDLYGLELKLINE